MLAGVFRFVCCNGLVVGDVTNDIRIPHKGNIQDEVIEGAFRVLDDFELVDASTDSMKALPLQREEQQAFATAALALRYGERGEGEPPAPVTAEQLIEARRPEDFGNSLWTTFQRVQENALRGGQPGRGAKGRRLHTRPVASIDRSVSLNRALWVLAEEMRKLIPALTTGASRTELLSALSRRRIWLDAREQRFATLDELNAWLGERCKALWSELRHPEHKAFSVAEMLDLEREHLMPMPVAFDGYVQEFSRVSSTCLVTPCFRCSPGRWR